MGKRSKKRTKGTPANTGSQGAHPEQPKEYRSEFAENLKRIFLFLGEGRLPFKEGYEATKAAFERFDSSNSFLWGYFRKGNPHFGDDIRQALNELALFFSEGNPTCYANVHILVYAAIRFEQ